MNNENKLQKIRGDRIRQARLERGMTQQELADALGYKSKSSIAHLENGRDIPRSMIVHLSVILQVSPAYLMGWEPKNKEDVAEDKNEEAALLQDDKSDLFDILNGLPERDITEILEYVKTTYTDDVEESIG